jgi:hypothetical protein
LGIFTVELYLKVRQAHFQDATRRISKHARLGILETMEGLGWTSELPTLGSRKATRWLVNPEVHEMFEDHATTSRFKKEELRKVMNTAFAKRSKAKG